jgi:hypothetical protein
MEHRKRRMSARPGAGVRRREPSSEAGAGVRRRRPSSEAGTDRDEAARRALEPLAPGERPRPLLAAIALATALGTANAAAYAAGATIGGKHPGAGVLAFSALMALLAAGMWTRRYLAVLAFEALLALAVLVFSLFLIESANVLALVVCLVVIGGGGFLFWKLVRVMGRLATPPRS